MRLTAEETLRCMTEHRISVFVGHPAYVEAVCEVGSGEVPRVIKRRTYWHEHADGASAIGAVVGEVAAMLAHQVGAR